MGSEMDKLTPDASEWNVLWQHHTASEKECVARRDYSGAAKHKQRADEIARHLAPADQWERAWEKAARDD